MDKQESPQDKFGKLINTTTRCFKKIVDAVEEGLIRLYPLTCVQNESLDFDLIEDDVRQIHQNLQARGHKVLGSHLILDDANDLMEIKTYTKRGEKTCLITVDAKVRRVTNIPSDLFDELKERKRIELSLKL